MKKPIILLFRAVIVVALLFLFACNKKQKTLKTTSGNTSLTTATSKNGGFASQIAWGRHLIMTSGCSDCHTPKKMTKMGPVPDTSRFLSGYPANRPLPDIDPAMVESKGIGITTDETFWIGPWGISYSANLTPDETGLGNWTEAQFMRAIRLGKYMDNKTGRHLLPPMPWQEMSKYMSDEELKAIFAYLKSIKPVHNVVPAAVAPAGRMSNSHKGNKKM